MIFISLRILHFGILLKYFETGSGQAGKPKIPSKIERLCLIKISLKRVLSNSRKIYIYVLNFQNVIILHLAYDVDNDDENFISLTQSIFKIQPPNFANILYSIGKLL